MIVDEDRDEYLMARVQHGQPELLERILRRHATPLLTFLERMTGNLHQSEELFQEVFLAVWRKRHQYHYPLPFKPWLYAIALNKCREAFRGQGCRAEPLGDEATAPASADASPADSLIASETAETVSRAVTELPPKQRAVVVLRVWHGLGYDRIAQIIETTEATARSHMHHALAALRQSLAPRLGIPQ
jgi:RNA polymerase sigma-70 factor (ECF subfamily)